MPPFIYGKNSYRLFTDMMDKQEAKQQCESIGSLLFTIESMKESNHVRFLLKSLHAAASNYWMGYTGTKSNLLAFGHNPVAYYQWWHANPGISKAFALQFESNGYMEWITKASTVKIPFICKLFGKERFDISSEITLPHCISCF